MVDTIMVKVQRQNKPGDAPFWEEFAIPSRRSMTVVSLLREIRRRPVTRAGQAVAPVVFEANCLQQSCGSCTMLIHGRPALACGVRLAGLVQPICLAPLSRFPVVRDLVVDRSSMDATLKRFAAWGLGGSPREESVALSGSPQQDHEQHVLAACHHCGCCLDACPQVSDRTGFVGAYGILQTMLFNQHPTGRFLSQHRLDALMGKGGLADCDHAQNCVLACPKEIPLTTVIARMERQVTRQLLRRLLG